LARSTAVRVGARLAGIVLVAVSTESSIVWIVVGIVVVATWVSVSVTITVITEVEMEAAAVLVKVSVINEVGAASLKVAI